VAFSVLDALNTVRPGAPHCSHRRAIEPFFRWLCAAIQSKADHSLAHGAQFEKPESKPQAAFIATSPNVLGWAPGAAFGAKLAEPDRPVVAVSGDGAMMFSGPQPLWTHARYKAPVVTIVYNNRSYNAERNRIWTFFGGDQFKQGRDMTCYNGDPDVNFAKAAEAYGVEAETVKEVSQIKPALERAKRATVEGRPYLLEVHVERDGIGAASAWHPAYSLADVRTRKV
jgi:thiamine pyrophosphate-dependent acetolactate synthase large subunit-like protein